MKDRFKFRIYCKSENKMMIFNNPTLIDGEILQGGLLFKNYDHKIKNVHEVKPEDLILMQCTGLKDKNGKLIFERDIVRLFNTKADFEEIRPVIFKDCAFQFNLPNSMEIDRPLYCWAINYLNHYKHIEIKIIGNIYETPELLEEQCANQLNKG